MTVLRDISIYWAMFHVIFLFLAVFRSRFTTKKTIATAVCRMDIQVGGEELPYMELCRILANGLENVCDALKKLEKNRREVSVHMWYHRDYLLVRIKNRCPDSLHVERGETLQTSKKEKGHGFGLLSIREAVERLDGDMVCYTENGYFMLDVMVRVRDTSCCKNGELCGGQPA